MKSCHERARLDLTSDQAHKAMASVLNEHHLRHGSYPESLREVLPSLPLELRQVAADFDYCKKVRPADRTSQCASGAESWADSEITFWPRTKGIDLSTQQRRSCPRRVA